MSNIHADQVNKPSWFKGIKPMVKAYPAQEVVCIGLDTESVHGKPHTFQWSDESGERIAYWPDKKNTLRTLIEMICGLEKTHRRKYIIWAHNLEYEFTQIFRHPEIPQNIWALRDITIEIADPEMVIRVFNDSVKAIFIRKGHASIWILDSFAFFKTSLDNAAKNCGIKLPKLRKPKGLGDKPLRTKEFETYAKRDALLSHLIGEYIVSQCESWALPIPISAPQMAGFMFRRHYVTEAIPKLESDVEEMALASYHGGKNGYYLDGAMVIDCYHADIRSAYPWAFTQLPEMQGAEIHYTTEYVAGRHGICWVAGFLTNCRYGCLQKASGAYHRDDGYVELCCTTYELDSAIRHGHFSLRGFRCYYVVPTQERSSLSRYAEEMFRLRSQDAANSVYYKLMANSLYGKFIQKTPIDDAINIGAITEYRAGALYHPLLASLITGMIRARLHDCEHEYGSIMTSTDGFFCLKAPPESEELGGFKVEAGRLKVFRARLYTFRVNGKIEMAAFHGFRGTMQQLDRLAIGTSIYRYNAMQVITMRMAATRKNVEPGAFIEKEYALRIVPP